MVVGRAGEGAADALSAIGYGGGTDKHPACQDILSFIGHAGTRGRRIRSRFVGADFGWPQDAIDGILLTLLANGLIRAMRNGKTVTVRHIPQSQIGAMDFYREGKVVELQEERVEN